MWASQHVPLHSTASARAAAAAIDAFHIGRSGEEPSRRRGRDLTSAQQQRSALARRRMSLDNSVLDYGQSEGSVSRPPPHPRKDLHCLLQCQKISTIGDRLPLPFVQYFTCCAEESAWGCVVSPLLEVSVRSFGEVHQLCVWCCRDPSARQVQRSHALRNSCAYDTIVEEEQRTNGSVASSPPNHTSNGAATELLCCSIVQSLGSPFKDSNQQGD